MYACSPLKRACYNFDFWQGDAVLKNFAIFGVGLIGGSLALALKQAMPDAHITGVGRAGETLQSAIDLGVIDTAASSAEAAIQQADIAIIAAPVAQTAKILASIAPHLPSHTIVTDVGSTKSDVIAHARHILKDNFARFVPGHPIAGAEQSGVTAARLGLFNGKTVVLTPEAETAPQALASIHEMWTTAGAQVVEMSAKHHDDIFAAVSHLPHLLAFALVENLAARQNAEELFHYAASGFRDFTRIAGSSPEMWRDISLANQTALLTEIDAYRNSLEALRNLLAQQDSAGLQALFERASQARNAWAHQPKRKP